MAVIGAERLAEVFTYYTGLMRDEPPPTTPWRKGGWQIATNGRILVAVKVDDSPECTLPKKYGKSFDWLQGELSDAFRADFKALRKFAGPVVPAHVDCSDCLGSGYAADSDPFACEHCGRQTHKPCYKCSGDGGEPLPQRFARIAGIPLNLAYLAFCLSIVPVREVVTVGYLKTGPTNWPVAVDGGDWRVLVMRIKEPAGPHYQLRVFTPSSDASEVLKTAKVCQRVTV